MLRPVFRGVADLAIQQSLHEVSATRYALRSALELTIGQRPLLRTEEWSPSNGERDCDRQEHANYNGRDEQNFPEFFHSVGQLPLFVSLNCLRDEARTSYGSSERRAIASWQMSE